MNLETINNRAEFEERLRFETLIADLSARFVNAPAGQVDREIADARHRLCEFLDLQMSVIQFMVWYKRRRAWNNLLLTMSSAAVAANTGLEILMLRAEIPPQFAAALRWIRAPVSSLLPVSRLPCPWSSSVE